MLWTSSRVCARLLLAAWACNPFMAAMAQDADLQRLNWLAGCWVGSSGEAGTGETWTPPAGGTLLGMGRTVKGGKTVAFEFMQIRQGAAGRLVLIAEPSGQRRTEFTLLSLNESEVVFENLQHDFPHRVAYRLDPLGTLHPRIEGLRNGAPRTIQFGPLRRAPCEPQAR